MKLKITELEKLAKYIPVVTPAIGRVVTNLINPESYNVIEKLKAIKNVGFKNAVKAVIKDKPIYKNSIPGRESTYRGLFGLTPRKEFRDIEKNIWKVKTDKAGKVVSRELNFNTPQGKEVLKDVYNKRARTSDKKTVISDFTDVLYKRDSPGYHSIMGGYDLKVPKGKKAAKTTYKDVWDVKINKGENISEYLDDTKKEHGLSNILRKAISKVTKPEVIKGEVKLPSNFKRVTPRERFRMESQLEPSMRIARETPDMMAIPDKADLEAAERLMLDGVASIGGIKKQKGNFSTRIRVPKIKEHGMSLNKDTLKSFKEDIKNHTKIKNTLRRAKNTYADDKVIKNIEKQRTIARKNLAKSTVPVVGGSAGSITTGVITQDEINS